MNRPWHRKTLGDVLSFYNGKAIKPTGGVHPVYGSNGIIGHTAIATYDGGIVIGRVGAYCGSVYYAQRPFWATDNTIVVKPTSKQNNTAFFYYLLRHLDLHRY